MGVSRRVLMHGKPGTGKTYHAVNAGIKDDQKVYQITMTDETPAAELRGHYIARGSEWVWTDGPAVRAWKEGARLVVNEIDRASEDALSFLYVIMDDPEFAETTLPTGEVIKPKGGFQVVATMNGVPEDLPEALQDRFPVDIEITDVHPKAIEALPPDLQEPAKNTTIARNGGRRLSIRSWMEFAKLRAVFDDDLLAAQAIFGNNAEDALMALKVAEQASEPQTMGGIDLNKPENAAILNKLKAIAKRVDEDNLSINGAVDYIGVDLLDFEGQTLLEKVEVRLARDSDTSKADQIIVTRTDGVRQGLSAFL